MDPTTWDDRYATGRQWSVAPNVFVVELCEALPPGRAADLAAGEGRNALWLASRGWEVTAVDFSAVALGRASEQADAAGVTLTTVVADVLDWEPGPVPFDLVLLCYLQLPAEGRARALDVAASVLAPGGRVVVVAHDLANLAGGSGGPQSPEVLWTAPETVAGLTDLGLAVEVAGVRERTVTTGGRPALDTVVVARRQLQDRAT